MERRDYAADMMALRRLMALHGQVHELSKDGYMIGGIEQEFIKLETSIKTRLQWSGVYRIDNGQANELEFEGAAPDCTSYVIDHPELKGCCIICPLA